MADDQRDPFKENVGKHVEIVGEEHSVQVEQFDPGDGKGRRKMVALQNLGGGPGRRHAFGSPEAKKLADKYPELKEWGIHDDAEADPEKAELRRRLAELEDESRRNREAAERENAARQRASSRRAEGFGARPATPGADVDQGTGPEE